MIYGGQKMNLEIIKKYEGLRLTAYLCPANKWTIGYGNTFYEDGTSVKPGDKITIERAESLLIKVTDAFWNQMSKLIKQPLTENQKSALLSFTYNVGIGNFQKSTLLKKVNANPNDLTIRSEFLKWVKSRGIVLSGLVKRRTEEANLYFHA